MRHQKRNKKFGVGGTDHRRLLLKTLAMNVIIHEKVKTTEPKAKAVASYIARLIDTAKNNDKLTAIRLLNKLVNHKSCSKKIMEQLVSKYSDRKSGYTRITKVGFRAGDCAPLVLIELV
jgi:large subunit ribosomal protein L17